jgi:hypothetical protein
MYARAIPNILPNDTQKFSNNNPFPRYFIGADYAYILVVNAIVKPKLKPYPNRIKFIKLTLLANKNINENIDCNPVPIMIRPFLPCLSDSLPLMIDPEKIPK